jgi:RNA polymerase sigma factor (sigma-70 family)
MTTAGNDTASSREDELLASVYRRVADTAAARYAAGYDLSAGLEQFSGWLQDHAGPELDADQAVAWPGFQAALNDLPERQREAIVLRYYSGLSEDQIATAMGISRGAVKSHIARGLAALRSALR